MKRTFKSETHLALLRAILLLPIMSCSRKQGEFEKILVDKQKCWANYSHPREEIDTAKMKPFGCTRFYQDGDVRVMSISGNKDEPLDLLMPDGSRESATGWSFDAKDSTFKVGDNPYNQFKVNFFCIDTISLKKANGESYTLVNMK